MLKFRKHTYRLPFWLHDLPSWGTKPLNNRGTSEDAAHHQKRRWNHLKDDEIDKNKTLQVRKVVTVGLGYQGQIVKSRIC